MRSSKPPTGGVLLFDGANFDAWAKKKGKEWLVEDGASPWKLVAGGAMEIVPNSDSIISKRKFGDAKVHVSFARLANPLTAAFISRRATK